MACADYGEDDDEFLTLTQLAARPPAIATRSNASNGNDDVDGGAATPKVTQNNNAPFVWDGFDQVRDLQEANERLLRKVDVQAAQIQKLKGSRTQQDDKTATISSSADRNSSAAAKKIATIGKKNRELTACLRATEDRNRSLQHKAQEVEAAYAAAQQEIAQLKRKLQKVQSTTSSEHGGGGSGESGKGTSASPRSRNAIARPGSVRHGSGKDLSYRTEVQTLSRELQMAMKVIHREIGEDATVKGLLSADSGWKGRAEKISVLQQKLKKAKVQQPITGDNEDGRGRSKDHREQLRALDKKRQADMEATTKQLTQAQKDLETAKTKCVGLKARNSSLIKEVKKYKEELEDAQSTVQNKQRVIQGLKEDLKARGPSHDAEAMMTIARLTTLCREQKAVIASLREEESKTSQRAKLRPSELRSRSAGNQLRDDSNSNAAAQLKLLEDENRNLTKYLQLIKRQQDESLDSVGSTTVHKKATKCDSLESAMEQLDLQRDENVALKQLVHTIRQSKDEEIDMLQAMMAETRKLALAALKKRNDTAKVTGGKRSSSASSSISSSRPSSGTCKPLPPITRSAAAAAAGSME